MHGLPAWVRGIGEQVSPVTLPALRSLVVCWDQYSLPTELVYGRVERSCGAFVDKLRRGQ